MQGWTELYENPTVLGAEWGYERIYSALSYAHIRALRQAPIMVGEARTLAAAYPLCWRIVDGLPVLQALMSLLGDGKGHYPAPNRPLPLALHAYPIAVPDPESVANQRLIIDRVFPDAPSDIGAPILLENAKMSKGAIARARLAVSVARGLQFTNALSRDLLDGGFLEPWPLKFDLGAGVSVLRDDLMVVAAARLGRPELFGLVETHGVDAGLFLATQRLSLFRISALLGLAKAAVTQAPDAATEPAL
ncbi:MAG: SapC family protein [Hyphomicrobiales bacterium]|uniref:SapC family protein n=1 Tax=Rhabdaerophilum calidifontis TaxID=2604328 RepID=UPI001238F6F8|nr:SapC family protein [Rhabdaerophilum calidifontis]MCA1951746.1 SapC family protein [Hyphomicrobiales bacterium]MCA1998604.1 SapC family protein [Hyphomicrobiales bacterium]